MALQDKGIKGWDFYVSTFIGCSPSFLDMPVYLRGSNLRKDEIASFSILYGSRHSILSGFLFLTFPQMKTMIQLHPRASYACFGNAHFPSHSLGAILSIGLISLVEYFPVLNLCLLVTNLFLPHF